MNEMAGTILYVLHNSHDLSALYYDCTTFIIDVRHFQCSVKNCIQKKTQIFLQNSVEFRDNTKFLHVGSANPIWPTTMVKMEDSISLVTAFMWISICDHFS